MGMSDSSRRHDADASEATSTAVVEAIAEREGVDPADLELPLYEAIDPDALDALFSPPGGNREPVSGRISFVYGGYNVEVAGDGEVTVTDREDE